MGSLNCPHPEMMQRVDSIGLAINLILRPHVRPLRVSRCELCVKVQGHLLPHRKLLLHGKKKTRSEVL